jgi:tRNA(Ile)-lysidine synthase
VQRDALVLATGAASERPLPRRSAPLRAPGTARLGGWLVRAELLSSRPRRLDPRGNGDVYLDADACGGRLSVRRRRPGDRFHPLGLARPKKLQDFLVDAHVARSERDALPLVCAARGIVWVAGQRPAEWAKVTRETRRVLRLSASPA